jgi:nucleoside-diphosphate-sugar epimerase
MRLLVTGHHGYIGSVVAPMLQAAGHEVVGMDTFFYEGCDFGSDERTFEERRRDVRDVTAAELEGFDAVVHLAALSNDPLGDRRASGASCSPHPAACTAPRQATSWSTRERPCGR